jgi:hypothetical protein
MADINLNTEQLEILVQQQAETIAELKNDVAALKLQAKASEIKVASKQTTKPVIPESNVTVDGKEYKWQKAQFKLLGDSSLYLAEEAQHHEALLNRIVSIPGQTILKEQV